MSELLTEIQQLLWPRPGICTDEAMYFRRDPAKTSYAYGKDAIFFELNGTVFFDTYFNAFSVSNWTTYAVPAELFLKVRFRGCFQIRLIGYQYRNGAVIPYTLDVFDVASEDDDETVFRFVQRQECLICSFAMIAMRDNSVFLGGAYCRDADMREMSEVGLALNICTYHRERFVLETLRRLNVELMDISDSPLRNHLRVQITDNGQTLISKVQKLPWVSIVSQNGQGSAGGFARGQIEIARMAGRYGLTHMIFMDDDISLDPRILIRTYWFLRSLKKEYREYILGGELLRLNFPQSQVEAGAQWNCGMVVSTKPNLDLRRLDHILFNELPERVEYQGWWFCCVPLYNNLRMPLPVYFRRDDVEFGLRNRNFIYLNGVCVWHDEFENKPNPVNVYYDTRNRFIVNSIHCPEYDGGQAARDLTKNVVRKVLTQRYLEAKLMLRGAADFCRGADWVIANDGAAMYRELSDYAPKLVPLGECGKGFDLQDYEMNLFHIPIVSKKLKIRYWLLGFLLPARYIRSVPMFSPSPDSFHRVKKTFHYDSSSERVLVTEKKVRQSLIMLVRLVTVDVKLMKKYAGVTMQWKAGFDYYTSEEFWEKKLDLGGNYE